MKITRTILCVFAIGAIALPLCAQEWWHEPELVEADHVYSMDFVTPHVQWAKPLPGGPIRALFFVRAKGQSAREIAEMAQRVQIEPQIVYYERTGRQVEGGEAGMARALRLIREGADVFVLGNVSFDGLTREAQYYLLEHVVKGGAGLVAVYQMPEIAFTDDRAMEELPAELTSRFPVASLAKGREMAGSLGLTEPTDTELAGRIITRYRLGEGRALGLRLPGGAEAVTPRLDFSFEALSEYEYWAGFAANAIRWAAGRDAAVRFINRPDSAINLHRSELPMPLGVGVTSDLPGQTSLTFHCTLCSAGGERIELLTETVECEQGSAAGVRVPMPKLPAGDHFMEMVVTSPRGAEAFGAQTVRVTSTRGVESVTLEGATEDAMPFGEVGETITGTVAMRGQEFTGDERLVLRLRDAEGRVVAREERRPQAGEVPFSFRVPEDRTILMRAEAALLDGDGEVDGTYAQFTVPRRCRGQFNFVMWAFPRGVLGYWGLRSMRDSGVTVMLSGGSPPPEIAANDLAYVPYTTRILENIGEDGVMQPVCWNNEPAVSEYIQEIADRYLPARRHGVYVYSLGDENNTWGACAHPECLKAYREWLRGQYETIEALNASWGSEYGSFDEIELFKEGDINEQAALNAGHFARWYDRQAFKRYNYAVYCGKYARAYAAMDPLAITGFEGAGRFGDDYGEIIRRVGFWGPYPSVGDDIIRSLAPRELITSNWMGYSREARPMVQRMWRMISNGYHGVWWWRWDNIGRFHGFLAPDFHPWDDTSQVIVDEMQDIQDGLGTMMLQMAMPHDGIGLLYSIPSAFAEGIAPRRGGMIDLSHNAFLEATQDLGYQAHYLSDDTVLEGDLNDGDERALILPLGRAMSDEVAGEIREFVRAGGLLIADLRPGIRDGHCTLREAGALDDVFGVTQRPTAEDWPQMEEVSLALDTTVGGEEISLALDTRIDPALQLAGGEALAEHEGVPLMIVNDFGEGTAVLLNFSLEAYGALREEMQEMPIRRLLGAIYRIAGMESPFRQRAGDGPLRWTETVRWETEGITVIGLFKTAGEDGPATTILPRPRHVYDLRNDRYLGETDQIAGELRVGFANLYALSDEAIGEVVLDLRGPVAPGQTLEGVVRVRGRGQGLLPVKLRVFRPDGTEQAWPRRELIVQDGVADVEIPIAYNAQSGTWRVTAREVLSSQTAEAEFTVAAQ